MSRESSHASDGCHRKETPGKRSSSWPARCEHPCLPKSTARRAPPTDLVRKCTGSMRVRTFPPHRTGGRAHTPVRRQTARTARGGGGGGKFNQSKISESAGRLQPPRPRPESQNPRRHLSQPAACADHNKCNACAAFLYARCPRSIPVAGPLSSLELSLHLTA